ncbi:MAG: hypothetical protein M1829_005155 [Trizodia sp. TS-e1964]|nr:MAG: hypothetical protein M1829_005155 [Trizodia sp. TS-e1964]
MLQQSAFSKYFPRQVDSAGGVMAEFLKNLKDLSPKLSYDFHGAVLKFSRIIPILSLEISKFGSHMDRGIDDLTKSSLAVLGALERNEVEYQTRWFIPSFVEDYILFSLLPVDNELQVGFRRYSALLEEADAVVTSLLSESKMVLDHINNLNLIIDNLIDNLSSSGRRSFLESQQENFAQFRVIFSMKPVTPKQLKLVFPYTGGKRGKWEAPYTYYMTTSRRLQDMKSAIHMLQAGLSKSGHGKATSSNQHVKTIREGIARLHKGQQRRHIWPETVDSKYPPTPYQIFNEQPGAPYSKQRFYELVKLYHPDRYGKDPSLKNLSPEVMLHRYRLVVAANALLSDPIKRSAYDRYGAGWNGRPEASGWTSSTNTKESTGQSSHFYGTQWQPRGPNDRSSQNSSWEDSARWYSRDLPKRRQQPQFFSNQVFIALGIVFAALGSVGQATRVSNYSVQQRDKVHEEISNRLLHASQVADAAGSKEARIESFLRLRQFTANEFEDERARVLEVGRRKRHGRANPAVSPKNTCTESSEDSS